MSPPLADGFLTTEPAEKSYISNFSHSKCMYWYLTLILICISLMTNEIQCLFMCVLAVCPSSSAQCLFLSFVYILTGLFSYCLVLRVLYTFQILVL